MKRAEEDPQGGLLGRRAARLFPPSFLRYKVPRDGLPVHARANSMLARATAASAGPASRIRSGSAASSSMPELASPYRGRQSPLRCHESAHLSSWQRIGSRSAAPVGAPSVSTQNMVHIPSAF